MFPPAAGLLSGLANMSRGRRIYTLWAAHYGRGGESHWTVTGDKKRLFVAGWQQKYQEQKGA